MKINRDSGGDRQVYHRGDQPSADRNSRPADRKAAPARRQPDEPAAPAGQIPAPPRRKAYDVTQDTAYEEELDLAPEAEDPPPRRRRPNPQPRGVGGGGGLGGGRGGGERMKR